MTQRHLLSIAQLSDNDIQTILSCAQQFIDNQQHVTHLLNTLSAMTLVNLFFEHSTRTRVSFELAAKRLGTEVININTDTSAHMKGESLLDTLFTLQAMSCQLFVVRHSQNGIADYLAEQLGGDNHIINAGDGTHAHPSQALLDALTIRQYKKNFNALSIAMIGDLAHSRVANSNITLLGRLGVKDIRLVAPTALLPEKIPNGCTTTANVNDGLAQADVIMVLRIQRERMQQAEIPDLKTYFNDYGLTCERLTQAKPDAIVMHPGPINRGVEIDASIADGSQSVIQQQVTNGIATRMAILSWLTGATYS